MLGAADSYKYLIPKVKLTKSRVDKNEAPLVHEITHIIPPFYSSRSFREGLVCYTQAKFSSETDDECKNKIDQVMNRSKTALFEKSNKKTKLVIEGIGQTGIPTGFDISIADLENRWDYYTLSHSFSYYIIEHYGISEFMKVYESENLEQDYETLFGKDLERLKTDWINL